MRLRSVAIGAVIWLAATAILRVGGQHVIPDHHWWRIVLLYGTSFVLMAVILRAVCGQKSRPLDERLPGALALLLPTLLLDPFSSAFFAEAFPNMPADSAGIFGGWMMISCAGGLVGVALPRRARNESTRSA